MAEMSLLSVNGLTKRFGGLVAVNAIDFDVRAGSITGLIGPNGAGKTTAFTMISGFAAPSAGAIRFDGQDIAGCEPDHLARLGIARTFQIVQPFAGLNVMENIAVGAYLRHTRPADALKVARAVAERVGLASEAEKSASALTVAGRKRLELARALATEPRLLLLDEVLAGLNPSEIRDILPVLRGVQADGITILMIEHVMQAVMSLCETVHVIAEGRMIATGNPAKVVRDSRVIEAYLGKGAAERLSKGDRHG
jgi:branched-chain amino acid transport system ATP-binding protein